MSLHHAPLSSLLEQLRRLVFTYFGVDFSNCLPLIRQALAFISREDPDSPDAAGFASDLAFIVADMLECSHNPAFIKSGLETLFRLGVLGENLAVSFVLKGTMAIKHLLAILSSMTLEERLLFANALLRSNRRRASELRPWAMSLTGHAANEDPEEVLVLLEHLFGRKDRPALPAVNELLGGRLGLWLQQLLRMPLSPEQTRYMAGVVGVLECPGLTALLAKNPPDADPQTLLCVCRAAAACAGAGDERIEAGMADLATTGPDAIRIEALLGLAGQNEPRAARTAAGLFQERPDLRASLVPFLASLSLAGFHVFLKSLPPPARGESLSLLFATLCLVEPRELWAILKAVARDRAATEGAQAPPPAQESEAEAAALARLRVLLKAFASGRPKDLTGPSPGRKPPVRTVKREDALRLVETLKRFVGLDPAKGDGRAPLREAFKDLEPNSRFHNKTFAGVTARETTFQGATFDTTVFRGAELQACVFSGATFAHCRFDRADFTASVFENVTFSHCEFRNCALFDATLQNVTLVSCEARATAFSDARAANIRFEYCRFDECAFFGFRAKALTALSSRFETCDLSLAVFEASLFDGAEFADCCLEKASFSKTSVTNAALAGCYLVGAGFFGLITDEPTLMEEAAGCRLRVVSRAAPAAAAIPVAERSFSGPELALLTKAVEISFFREDANRRLARVLANNVRRLAWAGHKLGEAGAAFLKILPGLLEAGKVKTASGFSPALPARIRGRRDAYESATLLARTLETPVSGALAVQGKTMPLPVEAVYAMGSLGAIAQTRRSDIDLWVCCREEYATPKLLERFQAKLKAIAAYAAEAHGLEIHFFLMTGRDIRENRFGFSDEESCGSSQAMLLKEEFYRTAILLAGRKTVWWRVPAGASKSAYEHALKRLERHMPREAADSIDLGHLGDISGPEYFGASLWLIVKSLKSPFKSVMKIGLLEKYLRSESGRFFLCNRIKENLFAGKKGLWETDPYALLFADVSGHFAARGDEEAVELMRAAFIQKTGMDPVERAPVADDELHGGRGMELFFPLYASPSAGRLSPEARDERARGPGAFSELTAASDRFAGFLARTYESLMASRESDEKPAVSERDLTILGRRISSRFGKKKNKIMRLPFVTSPRGLFATLEIASEERKGRDGAWIAKGEARGGAKRGVAEEIRREKHLESLAAWLIVNEVHSPGTYLKGGAVAAPISFPDVQDLFAAIREAFPLRESFDPPLVECLNPERVVSALLVVNLRSPREERRIVDISILYATNWGEMFFQDNLGGLHLLDKKPFDFLRYNIPIEIDVLPRVETFTPAKAQCPKLALSFYV